MENENNYKIYNLLKKYKKFEKDNFAISLENKTNIRFDVQFGTICHLLGLHYITNKKNKASEIGLEIVKYKLNDKTIYNKAFFNNGNLYMNMIKKRVDNLDYAFNNLEKGYIVKVNKNINSDIQSTNFILQTKDNKFLEIGIVNKFEDEYYLETFLVNNNDNRVDYSQHLKITGIYKENENYELKPFSFDEKKFKFIEAFSDYSYEKCIEIYNNILDNIENKVIDKNKDKKINKWNIKKDKDLER